MRKRCKKIPQVGGKFQVFSTESDGSKRLNSNEREKEREIERTRFVPPQRQRIWCDGSFLDSLLFPPIFFVVEIGFSYLHWIYIYIYITVCDTQRKDVLHYILLFLSDSKRHSTTSVQSTTTTSTGTSRVTHILLIVHASQQLCGRSIVRDPNE